MKFQPHITPNETPFSQALWNTIYIIFSPTVSFINKWQDVLQVLYPYSASPVTKVYLVFGLANNPVSFCRHWTFSPVARELFASGSWAGSRLLVWLYQGVRNLWDHLSLLCSSIVSATSPIRAPSAKALMAKAFIYIDSHYRQSEALFLFHIKNSMRKTKETSIWSRDQNMSTLSWSGENFCKLQHVFKILIPPFFSS